MGDSYRFGHKSVCELPRFRVVQFNEYKKKKKNSARPKDILLQHAPVSRYCHPSITHRVPSILGMFPPLLFLLFFLLFFIQGILFSHPLPSSPSLLLSFSSFLHCLPFFLSLPSSSFSTTICFIGSCICLFGTRRQTLVFTTNKNSISIG